MGVPPLFAQETKAIPLESPSKTENRDGVGVPPHVPKCGGRVPLLKTPHAIAEGVSIQVGGGYTPCLQVGGATLLSSGGY